jgi:hypothetical protein
MNVSELFTCSHCKVYVSKEFKAFVNFANSFFFALWLNLMYRSNALEFHLPHLFIVVSLDMWGMAARALGNAALKDLQLYNRASLPMWGVRWILINEFSFAFVSSLPLANMKTGLSVSPFISARDFSFFKAATGQHP